MRVRGVLEKLEKTSRPIAAPLESVRLALALSSRPASVPPQPTSRVTS